MKVVTSVLFSVHPEVALHPGPHYTAEGSNFSFPVCHVTGHPAPVVTWRKSSGQLPQGRVQYNNTALQISDVRKNDSDTYVCLAVNLLGSDERKTILVVVSLPRFTSKPSMKVVAYVGGNLTLTCLAAGDPKPVISWKRLGAKLPVGRSLVSKEALIISSVKLEDAGNYTCVATSGGVSSVEHASYIEVKKPGWFNIKERIVSSICSVPLRISQCTCMQEKMLGYISVDIICSE